jgi:hypothetical protein
MGLLASILVSDILPIFAIASAGFLLARYARVDVKTLAPEARQISESVPYHLKMTRNVKLDHYKPWARRPVTRTGAGEGFIEESYAISTWSAFPPDSRTYECSRPDSAGHRQTNDRSSKR